VQQDVLREHAEAPTLAVDRAEPALRLLARPGSSTPPSVIRSLRAGIAAAT
jgi:hypothetical protein